MRSFPCPGYGSVSGLVRQWPRQEEGLYALGWRRDGWGHGLSIEVIDGGDRACGELLLVLAARIRTLAPHSTLRLLATDPAAAIDLPAWCHLTGHRYLGHGVDAEARPYYDLLLSEDARRTQDARPWRLDPEPTRNHH